MGADDEGCLMIDDKTLIARSVEFGHHWSPAVIAAGGIDETALDKLTLADLPVKLMVQSYQQWFASELDKLTMRSPEFGGHARASIADGDVGDCTRLLLTMPRCGEPDYQNPLTAIEEGNWPEQCRYEITTSYQMNLSGLSEAQLASLWQEADRNWSDVLNVAFEFRPQDYPNTRFFAFAHRFGGSILADHYLAISDCSARLQGRYDTRTWSPVLFVTTSTHEKGHGLGFNHTNDSSSTMYPSITDASMNRRGRPNGTDLREARRVGYTERTSPPEPEPPGPQPPGPQPPEPSAYAVEFEPITIKGRVTPV